MKFRPALVLLVLLLIIVPTFAIAQGGIPKQIVPESCTTQPGGCQSICDVALLAQNVLNTGIYFAVFISAILFAYAGFQAATANGNAEKYGHAKSIFANVVIGLIIILIGWLAVDTLMRTMVGDSNSKFGPWNQVCNTNTAMVSPFDKFYA